MSKVAKWIFPAAGGKDGIIGTATAVVGFMTGNWGMVASGVAKVAGAGKKSQAQARQASILQLSLGETPREAVLGMTATGGSLVDVFNFGGQYGTDKVTRCVALADHAIDGIEGFYVNDVYYPWTNEGQQAVFSNKLSFHFRNATADGYDPPQHVQQNGGWGVADRMAGITHIWIDWYVDEKVWPQGHPDIRFLLRGLRVYDARFDPALGYTGPNPQVWEDRSTHRFSRNAKVLRYAYTRGIFAEGHHGDPDYLLIGRGLTAEEAPPELVIADANLCDEVVDGVARYAVDAVISASQPYIEVDGLFAAAMAGEVIQRQGTVEVEAGQAKAVVVTITDDDLVAGEPIKFSDFLPDNDGGRVNTVIGRYVEPALGYRDHSAPVRRSLSDIQADGGPREQTISLPFVTQVKQVDRIIEIRRLMSRLERRASIVLPPKFAGLEEGDWIAWQSQRRHGGATRRYRIETYRQPETWRMYLTLREIASSVFGVPDPVEDTTTPPPPPQVIDALALTGVEVEAITLPGENSTVPGVRFKWTAPVDAAVLAIRAEVRRAGETEAAPTRTEGVDAGIMVATNGVGPDQVLECRLVPIGDPSRPVIPSAWVSVSTADLIASDTTNIGGRPAPEVIQQLDDIVIDVDGIRADVGTALDQALEAKTLAASSGYPSMNPNPVFARPWESGVPPEWSAWGNGTANARWAAGVESNYGFQIDVPSTGTVQDASRGLFQPNGVGALNTAAGDAFYVAELTVRLDAGLLNGTGMHVQFYNASGGVIGSTNINASADEPLGASAPGNGVVGRVYRYAKLFKTEPGTVTLVPYAMALWEGYFGQAVGKTVTFTKCRIRPAEAGEIEEGKARGSYPTLEARLTDQNTSLVSATAALALRQSVTEARATTLPNRLRNSDAALKLRYWDSTGSGALWSYYDDANFGTLFGALGGPEGADYFLISDRVAVYGSSTYTVSFEGDGGTRPGEAYLYISQLDAAGNYIPAGDGLGMINFGGVSWTTRKSTTFTTRSDCAFIRVVFLKKGGAGFNAFVSRIMLNATAAVVGWTDAATAKDIGGRVETSEGVLATVSGRVQAWFQKVVQAGDGTAFIQAKAIDDNGNVTSEVNLGARKIGMFTQIGNGWVEVLKLIGTSAHFAGKVFLGALQQITFDPDIPALIFTPPGGTVKMLYGAGFGVNADCIMWLGPKATDVGQISRTNGNWAFGTDGKVYYGTAELGSGGGSSAGYKTMDGSESNFSNYSVIAEAEVSNFAANSYVEADIMTVTQGWFQNQQDTYEGVMKLTAQLVSGGAEVTIFEETCYAQNSELQIPGGGFQASWSYPFGAKAVNLGGPVRFRWYCRKTFGTAPGGVHRMTIKITPPA